MAREIEKLTPLAISRAKKVGLHGDGGGLYLQIGPTGAKSWLFRFMLDGKAREMGLGPLHTVNVTNARARAVECRTLLLAGIDPIDARRASEAAERLEKARAKTFRQCAEAYIDAHRPEWKNGKHVSQWENTLRDYVHPTLGDLPVAAIDTDLVLNCLSTIWSSKTETATRVRQRVELIIDWATAKKFRQGENPARWRGHLDKLLPKPGKVATVKHHAALPYKEIAGFMTSLQAQIGIAARALEFAILTAGRTGEVIGATWEEFDLDNAMWTVPAERMKMKREHRVPLSGRAVQIVTAMRAQTCGNYVFPGISGKKPLSSMALLMTLRRMSRPDLTAHGFRSTFRDWAAETTAYPRDVAEMALAHKIANKTEAAYRRGDLVEKRQRMMDDWARYCATPIATGEVIPLQRRA